MAASTSLTPEQRTLRASAAARARWDRPENVERRVDALAEHARRVVDRAPELTSEQRARLAAALAAPND